MARICCLLAALTLLPGRPVLSWPDIISRIERGAAASDEAALRTAIDDARAFADAAGLDRDRHLALLGSAYAANRLAGLQGVEPAESSALLQRAEKDLREVIKADPRSAEARVLLAAVYALTMIMAMWSAALLVSAAVAIIAVVLVNLARSGLKRVSVKPDRLIASLQENVRWAKKQTS